MSDISGHCGSVEVDWPAQSDFGQRPTCRSLQRVLLLAPLAQAVSQFPLSSCINVHLTQWRRLLVSFAPLPVYHLYMKGVDQEKRQGKRSKKGWERKWANNHRLRWKHEPGNNRYYIPAHLQWNCICLSVKGSETKHVRAAINGHSWQTPSFGCLAAHQITRQAPKCIIALMASLWHRASLRYLDTWHFSVCFMAWVYGPCGLWWQSDTSVCKRWFIVWLEAQFAPDDGLTWEREGKEVRSNTAQDLNLLKMLRRTFCVSLFSRVATLCK